MPDNNEELKQKIEKMEKEIEDLKIELKRNSKRDKKHHNELKDLQEQNLKQQRLQTYGVFGTPLAAIIGLITWWVQNKNKTNGNEEKMSRLLKLLEENKKKE